MKQLFTLGCTLVISAGAFAQYPRTVLLELSESTWTATNSTAICTKEAAKSIYGTDLAVISYHWDDIQNGGDPMFKQFANEWSQTYFISQWGRGAIDRVAYDGIKLTSLDPFAWNDTIAARINRTTEALVTIPELLYDAAEDEIFVRLQLDFGIGNIANREMRFFLYLVQDGVVATQVVDTAELGTCTLFSDTTDTAFNYYHNDVAILNPSSYQGTDNIIPLQVLEDSKYSAIYTFDKPAGINLSDLRVVGFAALYSNADVTKNQVLNAAQKVSFTNYDKSDVNDPNHPDNADNPNSRFNPNNWPTSVNEIPNFDYEISVSPNPANDIVIAKFQVPNNQTVEATLVDMQGRKVSVAYNQTLAKGEQRAAFNTENIPAGYYIIQIEGQNFVSRSSVVVSH